MKLRIKALMIISIALIAPLFAAGPIVLDHQAFAAHHPLHKGSGDSLQGVGYGPCFQGKFSYTWCLKRF